MANGISPMLLRGKFNKLKCRAASKMIRLLYAILPLVVVLTIGCSKSKPEAQETLFDWLVVKGFVGNEDVYSIYDVAVSGPQGTPDPMAMDEIEQLIRKSKEYIPIERTKYDIKSDFPPPSMRSPRAIVHVTRASDSEIVLQCLIYPLGNVVCTHEKTTDVTTRWGHSD